MPNAHTHLAAVTDLLGEPALRQAAPWLAEDAAARSAFLLGAISPDVRTVSGQAREATHFFTIPPTSSTEGPDAMLAAYPDLNPAASLNPVRAAFVAGYITHLVMDQTWLEVVVMPGLFVDGLTWGVHHPNWRLYSILMTWLEYRAAPRVQPETAGYLGSALPDHWLPFVEDEHLIKWRDHVIRMMQGVGPRRTSEIFARSNDMSPDELEALVLSEDRMAAEAYPTVAPDRLATFEADTARRSLDAVLRYLADG
jgi:hypothetical protein